jgi:hypothetical protein
MKVTGPGPVRNNAIQRTRKGADRGGKGGFADEVAATDAEPGAATQVRGPSALAPVDALIALQEVDDATSGRKRALARGRDMLDLLDNIRHGLLIGGISRGKLHDLVRAVKSERQEIDDPKLREVLDEIELRAAVELAKYDRA